MAQFPLLMNGVEVCTLEDLKKNFNPADLVACRKRFAAWLKGWDYDEEAVEVKALEPELTDEQWLGAVCKALDFPVQTIENISKMRQCNLVQVEQNQVKNNSTTKKKDRSINKLKISKFITIEAPWHNDEPDDLELFSVCDDKIFVTSNNAERNLVYISEDGKSYECVDITLNDGWGEIMCCPILKLNNYFIYPGTYCIHFSKDGYDWESSEPPISPSTEIYDEQVFISTGKQFAFISVEENAIVLSDTLEDDWDVYHLDFEPKSIYYHENKFYIESAEYDDDFNNLIYCSSDAVKWCKLDESVDTEFIDALKRKHCVESGRKIFFEIENDTEIFASTELDGEYVKVANAPFETKKILVFENQLLIFGKNNEYATATYNFE